MVRGRVQTQTPAVTCRSRAQPGELYSSVSQMLMLLKEMH